MTKEQLEEVKTEVASTVRVVVNGKIDDLKREVAGIHLRLNEQDVLIAPAIETIRTIRSGVNFTKWIWPVFIIIGIIVTWIKN